MGTLHIILNIVLILASAALVVSVLMQKTKSSGLGSAFHSDDVRKISIDPNATGTRHVSAFPFSNHV